MGSSPKEDNKPEEPCDGSTPEHVRTTLEYWEEVSKFSDSELEQIKDLCLQLWPPTKSMNQKPSKRARKRLRKRMANALQGNSQAQGSVSALAGKLEVERIRGGSFKKVAGIDAMDQDGKVEKRMVIRVAQETLDPTPRDVSILRFVRKHTDLPVAEILACDWTENNPLSIPYVIQSRVPGRDLESEIQSYPSLSHKQKLSFVEQYCKILSQMREVQHPWPGDITSTDGDTTFSIEPFEIFHEQLDPKYADRPKLIPYFKTRPFGVAEDATDEDPDTASYMQSPLYLFEAQFGRWRTIELGLDPTGIWVPNIWQRMQVAVNQMYEHGCLNSEYNCLTHFDLDPRNIMVEIQDGDAKITGIVDWDLAMFAPDFVSCKPPMWIWNWVDGGGEDEAHADDDPPTEEQQELKDLFDELMGIDYTWKAYQPHYRIARELFRFARYGLRFGLTHAMAEKVLDEWDVLYEEKERAWKQRCETEETEEDGDDDTDEDAGQDVKGGEGPEADKLEE